jgi:beta-galactosidase GanA
MSSYAPAWVKRDPVRFPRAQTADGRNHEILTVFSDTNLDADRKAFAALMRHISAADKKDRTVIMVQVENEIGMIETARDHSAPANNAFGAPVPQSLFDALANEAETLAPELLTAWSAHGRKTSGTWAGVFGADARSEEIFMAWAYARYVEAITRAGKDVYDLPMFVNAALIRPGFRPGQYPSAGPLPHLRDLWRIGAPSIDFLAPDIYFPNFVEWTTRYAWPGNTLFIPEANQANAAEAPANALFAIGELGAIGFSPFSIESIEDPETAPLADLYASLDSLSPLILDHLGANTMKGLRTPVNFDGEADLALQTFTMGGYRITATFIDPWTPRENQAPQTHGAIIIHTDKEEFLFAGAGVTFTFEPEGGGRAGIDFAGEGRFESGAWIAGRRLNGDQTHQGRHIRLEPGAFAIQRVRLYRY